MICSYCKTETNDQQACSRCKADLTKKRPVINNYLSEEESELTQPELSQFHTYDLLLILRHIRTKRTEWYKLMQTTRRSPNEARNVDYEDLKEFSVQEYRNFTYQKNIIEEILIDRMGYYPQRVDDKLLTALLSRIEKSKK